MSVAREGARPGGRVGTFQPGQVAEPVLAGAFGALVGLFVYGELAQQAGELASAAPLWWGRNLLAGGSIGGLTGFCLNGVGPWREGAYLRLARAGTWGALAGAVGGALALILGEYVLGGLRGGLLGRALSWGVMGLGIGISQGLAQGSRQRLVFGVIGGLIGGITGGALFEAVRGGLGSGADPARGQGVGIVLLGAGLGFWLALVEQALRRAWVVVVQGRQEGRAYLLAGKRSRLGLDERAEVGLFGDAQVARRHAEIEAGAGGRYILHPMDGQGRTQVNGTTVAAPVELTDGDRVTLGRTVLVFRRR